MLPENLSIRGIENEPVSGKQCIDTARHEFYALRLWVREHWRQGDKLNHNRNSYHLKHVVEKCIDRYVSNGELIAAMILEGYKTLKIKPDPELYEDAPPYNVVFNVDEESVVKTLQNNMQESE